MAAVEQRLCSGGNGGCGVLGLGAVIAWEMGLLVRRGWLKRQAGDLGGWASKESSPEISARWMRALRGADGAGGRGL